MIRRSEYLIGDTSIDIHSPGMGSGEIFLLFLHKKHDLRTHKKCLGEALLISTSIHDFVEK